MLEKGLQEIEPGVWGKPPSKSFGGLKSKETGQKEDVLEHIKPIRVNVKPLSVNSAFKGQRFKTKEYQDYERKVLALLPNIKIPDAPYEIYLKFYFSNSGSDVDNPVKLAVDIMQKKYFFNDKLVYKITSEKALVKKGQECFEFMILPYFPTCTNIKD